jgi:hypothetical protein
MCRLRFNPAWAHSQGGHPREARDGEACTGHDTGRRADRRWPKPTEDDTRPAPPQGGEPKRRRSERRTRRQAGAPKKHPRRRHGLRVDQNPSFMCPAFLRTALFRNHPGGERCHEIARRSRTGHGARWMNARIHPPGVVARGCGPPAAIARDASRLRVALFAPLRLCAFALCSPFSGQSEALCGQSEHERVADLGEIAPPDHVETGLVERFRTIRIADEDHGARIQFVGEQELAEQILVAVVHRLR